MNKLFYLFLSSALFAITQQKQHIAFAGSFSNNISPSVEEVKQIIEDKYIIGNVEDKHLQNGAIDGMLRSLDPYSTYFDAEELQNFDNNTNGMFSGVGMEMIATGGDNIMVSSIFKDAPADKAGIIIGDIITQIDDKTISGMKLNQVSKMIRGERGTKVKLTLYRPTTGETYSKVLTRSAIKMKNVSGRVRDNIAIIDIKMFNNQTYNSFVETINNIRKKNNIDGLIIDLRNNPGGLLESAVDLANLFLSNGQLITSVVGRNGKKEFDYIARNKENVFDDLPIVLLVNKGSASASEILAGCLQDYGIATLIGEQTFGKALVQQIFSMRTTKGAVKLTTGQYHTPKDKKINGVGIKPDIEVNERRGKGYDDILDRAIKYIKAKV